MFTKHLMISGLKRQDMLLNELIGELKNKNDLDFSGYHFFEERAGKIANNLRQLRKIKDQYALYLEPLINLD